MLLHELCVVVVRFISCFATPQIRSDSRGTKRANVIVHPSVDNGRRHERWLNDPSGQTRAGFETPPMGIANCWPTGMLCSKYSYWCGDCVEFGGLKCMLIGMYEQSWDEVQQRGGGGPGTSIEGELPIGLLIIDEAYGEGRWITDCSPTGLQMFVLQLGYCG